MGAPIVVIRQSNRTPIHLSVREPIELGRECDGLLLADPQASRRHLRLEVSDGRVLVTDLGSTNGTTLDGRNVTAPVVLLPGGVVVLGSTTIELLAEAPDTEGPGADPAGVVSAGVTQIDGAAPFDGGLRTSIDLVASSLGAEDLSGIQSSARGTITIVFSDIESSTQRNMEMGDQEWFDVLNRHNAIVRRNLARFEGREIKNQGDGFMMSFPGARLALQSMFAVQRDLAELATDEPDRSVRVRMGLHTGEVLVDDDGDLFGKHVVVAARIADKAMGGEILVSSLVKEITSSRGDVVYGPSRVVELKGIEGEHQVFPVDWTQPLND